MFEHLDDPRPPVLGDSFRRAVDDRARRHRRRRRLARGGAVAVCSLVVGTFGLYGRALWRADDIGRVDIAGTAAVASGDPVTVLLVGVDAAAAGEAAGWPDALTLARVDPRAGTVGLLSLPRDLMVEGSGGSGPQAINSVAGNDDLEDLVTVIETDVGVPVDHVVQIDVDGFRSLVDRVGGLDVRVERPVRDRASGLYLAETGCTTLDGDDALALVRSRKIEVLTEEGHWVRDQLSDLRRTSSQRQVLLSGLAALADVRRDPVTLHTHVDWMVEHVVLDSQLRVADVVDLVEAIAAVDPAAVSEANLPVVDHPADPNRLAADPDRAPAVVAAFVEGRPLPSEPLAASQGGGDTFPEGDGAVVEAC